MYLDQAIPMEADEGKQASSSSSSLLHHVEGDIMSSGEQFIAHQCNCTTTGAKGLAKVIFRRCPWADCYRGSAGADRASRIGDIDVRRARIGFGVINMFAQVTPGRPKPRETAEQREAWFRSCLGQIARQLEGLQSIAFPYQIGCGLAGGDWLRYEWMLEEFAQHVAPARVVVYRLESAVHTGRGGEAEAYDGGTKTILT